MSDKFRSLLVDGLKQLSIEFDDKLIDNSVIYKDMLVEWNGKVNLTSILDDEGIAIKHFIDSLAILKMISFSDGDSLIDIGTGAGFPGIPLAMMCPHLRVTLLDSLKKRCNFLEEVRSCLNLDNVVIIHGRAEDIGRDQAYRQQFDYSIARAVANMSTLLEYGIPMVKDNGKFLAMKSGDIADELDGSRKALHLLNSKIDDVFSYQLPIGMDNRSLVVVSRQGGLSSKYPRNPGMPSKKPL